jgi:predicted branched-subunit amino acid permease
MQQPLPSASPRSDFLPGFARGGSIALAMIPVAMLFGALAVQNGLSFGETVLMSATVFGGASQLVGIELFGQHVPAWLIVFSIFAVNFRHVLYSAALGRRLAHWTGAQRAIGFFFLTDPQFAEAEARAEQGTPVTFAWYMGMALPLITVWIGGTAVGAWFGGMISDASWLGVDFLMPIYFLGLVIGFRRRPLWLPIVLASGAASVLAYHTVGSPWHVSLGALAGILLAVVFTPAIQERADA